MKRTITISYWWKCEKLKTIPPELQEALEETAWDRITEMMAQGFTSGQLQDNVNMDLPGHRTPKDGWECKGWWDTTTNKEE